MKIMMSTSLEKLNRSQREAVTHETRPLLIIAGPAQVKHVQLFILSPTL